MKVFDKICTSRITSALTSQLYIFNLNIKIFDYIHILYIFICIQNALKKISLVKKQKHSWAF